MMWLKTNPDGTPSVEGVTSPYCYHIDQFSELQPVIHRVLEYCGRLGLDMIQGDHEDAPGQLELNFAFDRAELTADRLTTYRQVCRQVGRESDCFPVSCPSPSWGVGQRVPSQHLAVAGRHQHVPPRRRRRSDTEQDRAARHRRSPGPSAGPHGHHRPHGELLSSLRRCRFLGARLRRLGVPEPHHRHAGQRPGRFEYRSVDSSVNPYLSMAALLAAMRDGLDQSIDPGPPEEGNIYEAIAAGKSVERLPAPWGRRSTPGGRPRHPPPFPATCTGYSCTTSATSGSGSSGPSASGTSRNTSTSCHERGETLMNPDRRSIATEHQANSGPPAPGRGASRRPWALLHAEDVDCTTVELDTASRSPT